MYTSLPLSLYRQISIYIYIDTYRHIYIYADDHGDQGDEQHHQQHGPEEHGDAGLDGLGYSLQVGAVRGGAVDGGSSV